MGALNEETRQPWGLTPSKTCLIVPSFPPVSIACRTIRSPLPVLGVEPLLQLRDAPALRLELLADVFLAAVVLRLARIHVREPERRAGLDPVARVVRLRRWLLYDELLRSGGRRHRRPSRPPRRVQRLLFFAHECFLSSRVRPGFSHPSLLRPTPYKAPFGRDQQPTPEPPRRGLIEGY
jgi:hypothetical protein